RRCTKRPNEPSNRTPASSRAADHLQAYAAHITVGATAKRSDAARKFSMQSPSSVLLTDLYQLTMLQCYDRAALHDVAVFDLFVRRLPKTRNFLIAAGLEQALHFLETARFTTDELEWLAGCGHLRPDFVDHLAGWRFAGDVDAMPEGTIFFADEPMLRVT